MSSARSCVAFCFTQGVALGCLSATHLVPRDHIISLHRRNWCVTPQRLRETFCSGECSSFLPQLARKSLACSVIVCLYTLRERLSVGTPLRVRVQTYFCWRARRAGAVSSSSFPAEKRYHVIQQSRTQMLSYHHLNALPLLSHPSLSTALERCSLF